MISEGWYTEAFVSLAMWRARFILIGFEWKGKRIWDGLWGLCMYGVGWGMCLSQASQGHRGKEWPTRNSSPQSGGREPIKGRPEAICVSPADLCRHRVLNLNLWDQWCALRGWRSKVGFFSHFPKGGTLKHSEAQILSATASFQSQILENTVMRGSSVSILEMDTHPNGAVSALPCPLDVNSRRNQAECYAADQVTLPVLKTQAHCVW